MIWVSRYRLHECWLISLTVFILQLLENPGIGKEDVLLNATCLKKEYRTVVILGRFGSSYVSLRSGWTHRMVLLIRFFLWICSNILIWEVNWVNELYPMGGGHRAPWQPWRNVGLFGENVVEVATVGMMWSSQANIGATAWFGTFHHFTLLFWKPQAVHNTLSVAVMIK